MQFTILALASLLAAVGAQNGVPSCAAGCIKTLPTQCQAQDIGCICGDNTFITNVSCCVAKDCAQSDQAAALSFALNICAAGDVTLTNTAATCIGSATSSLPSSTSTTPASITSGGSSQGSGSATTSASTSGATAGMGSGSATMTSGSSTSSGSTAPSTGAAPKITAMAGFFGAAAAAVALL